MKGRQCGLEHDKPALAVQGRRPGAHADRCTGQRIAEAAGARWNEFDLQEAVGSIPRGRHIVPIPPRLLAEVKTWREANGPGAVFVCPTPRDPHKIFIREAVRKFYRDVLGSLGKHSRHSSRSVLKSWCAEAGKNRDARSSSITSSGAGPRAPTTDRSASNCGGN